MPVFATFSVTLMFRPPRLQFGRTMNGGADARIGPAWTDVRHSSVDVGVRRSWRLLQQRYRGHDLPRLAIAALRNIELDPRQLQGVLSICGKPLDRGDVLAGNGSNRIAAGPDGLTVDQHCAGATLRDTAAEFRSLELEGIAQHPQQRRVRLHVDRVRDAVHADGDCHSLLPVCDQLSAPRTSVAAGCTKRRLSAVVPVTSPPFSRMLDPMSALLKRGHIPVARLRSGVAQRSRVIWTSKRFGGYAKKRSILLYSGRAFEEFFRCKCRCSRDSLANLMSILGGSTTASSSSLPPKRAIRGCTLRPAIRIRGSNHPRNSTPMVSPVRA